MKTRFLPPDKYRALFEFCENSKFLIPCTGDEEYFVSGNRTMSPRTDGRFYYNIRLGGVYNTEEIYLFLVDRQHCYYWREKRLALFNTLFFPVVSTDEVLQRISGDPLKEILFNIELFS